MSSRNRARRIANREARAAAEAQARVRARRQRWIVAIVALVAAVAVAGYFVFDPFSDDDDEVAAEGDTTTTVADDVGPCVPVADPLPEGAPDVPVKEGDPPTELVIEDIVVGEGAEVVAGSTVTVNYIGVACSTGVIFDESYTGGQPATFSLDGVIPGWTEGIPGMKVGGQRLLGIPSTMAYGATGSGDKIGPNETLWFVVEMQDTQPPATIESTAPAAPDSTTPAATDTTGAEVTPTT